MTIKKLIPILFFVLLVHGVAPAAPPEVRYTVNLKRVIDRKLKLGIADGTVELDGEVIFNVKDMRVGLFRDAASA